MRTRLAIAVLVVIGVLLMANPLYLPVMVGEPDPAYTHTVQPVEDGSLGASVDADESELAASTIDYEDLDPDAREAFDRALDAPEDGFGVEDPEDRVDSLSYPTDPTLGNGLFIVVYEDERYEFWTRTVERDPPAVLIQRAVVQPVAFLAGFFAVIAAVALGFRRRLDDR